MSSPSPNAQDPAGPLARATIAAAGLASFLWLIFGGGLVAGGLVIVAHDALGGYPTPRFLLVGSFAAGVPLLTAGIVMQGWLRQRQRVVASRGFEVVPTSDRSPPL